MSISVNYVTITFRFRQTIRFKFIFLFTLVLILMPLKMTKCQLPQAILQRQQLHGLQLLQFYHCLQNRDQMNTQ